MVNIRKWNPCYNAIDSYIGYFEHIAGNAISGSDKSALERGINILFNQLQKDDDVRLTEQIRFACMVGGFMENKLVLSWPHLSDNASYDRLCDYYEEMISRLKHVMKNPEEPE